MSVLGGQWENMGPEEATRRANAASYGRSPTRTRTAHKAQLQMDLGPEADWQPEPHQQTPEQFARDPRSWFHGRFASRLTKGGSNEGFHAGTEGAARKRLETNFGRRGGRGSHKEGHLFPLRLVGATENDMPFGQGATPDNPQSDQGIHRGLRYRSAGYFYKNLVEDPGHISVGVPKREGFLATQKELVQRAKVAGKKVNPMIDWAVKKAPAHTGEDATAHKRASFIGDDQPKPKQLSFADALPESGPYPPDHQREYQDRLLDRQKEVERWQGQTMAQGSYRTDRASYTTAGGEEVNAWRIRGGDANEPKQWRTT